MKTCALGDALSSSRPGFASGKRSKDGVVQLRMNNVRTDGALDLTKVTRVPATEKQVSELSLTGGDVLFNCTNSSELVGKTCLFRSFPEPVVFSNHFLRLRTRPEVLLGDYLARWLTWTRNRGTFTQGCVKWVNQATYRRDDLLKLQIPLPSLPEQKRIAEVLGAADALRRKRREALAQLEPLLHSTFLAMFGDPVTNPMGWEVVELGSLVDQEDKINYGVVQPGGDFPGGKPLIRVGDFVRGRLSTETVKLIDPRIEAKYERSRLNGRELLISCVGSIGTICKVPRMAEGFNIARAVARVPLAEEINRGFMLYCLRSQAVQRYFLKETRTVSQPTLNIGLIKIAPVIQPPEYLRSRFAAIVDSVEQQETGQRAHLAELDNLFASLQQRAFAGELSSRSIRPPAAPE